MVASWKEEEVKNLAKKVKNAKVIGLVGITGIPSKQFAQMRKSLRGRVDLRITKNRLIKRVLKKAETQQLEPYIKGEMGVLTSDSLNPFQLEKLISQSKTSAPAKPGAIAPHDIIIPAGGTPFAAGPVIGELQLAGVRAKIVSGKIVVTTDSKIASAGEPISANAAGVLKRFGIEPFEIGMDLYAALEDGIVYPGEVLRIDEEKTIGDLVLAHQRALNLAFDANLFNSETISVFIQKAHWNALNLALEAEIPTKETIKSLLGKAGLGAQALAAIIPQKESKAEEKKEAPKKEEKPKEKKGTPKEETKPEEKTEEKPTEEKTTEPIKEESTKKGEPEKEPPKKAAENVESPKEEEKGKKEAPEKIEEKAAPKEETPKKPPEEKKEEPAEKLEKPTEEKPTEEPAKDSTPKEKEKKDEEGGAGEGLGALFD
ncbi:MAG: 50S ribosomal protein L10 [Candidatus Altiarchaeota archaeon]